MRLKLSLLSLSVYLAMTVAAHALIPAPAIDLNTDLPMPQGDVLMWVNGSSCGYGLAGKKFVACGQPPTNGTYMGMTGIYFNGNQGFVSEYGADGVPWSLTNQPLVDFSGSAPYTISYWALNPSYNNSYETVFAWTNRNGDSGSFTKCCFFMGTHDQYGAINHWGTNNDMAYDRGVPQAGLWHNIAVTYTGATGWETIYVDGIINAIEKKPMDQINQVEQGDPLFIGITDDNANTSNFSGWLHSVKVYPAALSNDEVLTVGGPLLGTIASRPSVPTLVNPSFELVQGDIWVVPVNSTNVNRCDSRTIPGWAYVPYTAAGYNTNFIDGSARRGGIAVNVPNRGMVPGGGWWDNGLNYDGSRVLALVGQSTYGRAVSQFVYLKTQKTYHIRVFYNCAATGSAVMNIKVKNTSDQPIDTLDNMPLTVSPVEQQWSWSVPFYTYESDILMSTNPSGQYSIEISNDMPSPSGGPVNALLIDKVELYEYNPTLPMGGWPYPATIDFGYVQKGLTKDLTFHVQNMGGRTLNLMYYSKTGTDGAQVDFIDAVKPGTSGSTPNIQILGYQNTDLTLRFTATTAVKTYTGNMMVRYTNGAFQADQIMPWTATVTTSPTVVNGSFEQPYNANETWSGTAYYANYGQSYKIPGWLDTATSHGIGVGDRNNGQNINYGNVPDGHQALWIQGFMPDDKNYYWYAGKSRSVSQKVAGFVGGKTYKIVMYVNARNQGNNRAYFQFKINGNPVSPASYPTGTTNSGTFNGIPGVMAIGRQPSNAGGWYRLEFPYAPTADGAATLELVNVFDTVTNNLGESCLNVDAIKIYDVAQPNASRVAHTTGLGYWNTQYMGPGYPVNFGTGTSGSPYYNAQTVRVYNEGGKDLNVSNIAITGTNARDFKLYSAYGTTKITGGGNYSDFTVQFAPRPQVGGGIGSAYLSFNTDDSTKTATLVPLYGVANRFPVIVNGDFQQPTAYWDDTGTIWRCLGLNVNPANWSRSSGLTGFPPVDNYGSNNTGVDSRINIGTTLNPAYQNGNWHPDNGLMPMPQLGYIQVSTSGTNNDMSAPKGIYQNVDGFQKGTTYHVKAMVNSRWVNATNDHTVRGALLHYKDPGTGKWVNLADPTDVTSVDPQYTFSTPYTAIEGDLVCTATGRHVIELWVPQQDDDSSLLIQSITVTGPAPLAVKSWNMFE